MSGFGGFGTGGTSNSSLTFGVNKTTSQGLTSFTMPTTTQATSDTNPFGATGFGAAQAIQFGAPTTNTGTAVTTSGFSFSTPATVTGGLTFGTPVTTKNFGLSAVKTTGSATFGFGTPSTTLSVGGIPAAAVATTTVTGFNLGMTTTTAPTGLTLSQPATTQSTGLTFGLPKTTSSLTFPSVVPTTTTSTGFGFNFATTTTSTTAPTLSFGVSTATGLGLGNSSIFSAKTTANLSLSTSTVTTSVGLGGVDNKQTKTGLSGVGSTEPKLAKENALPDPILQTLNEFQAFTKQQKSISVEISHSSSKPLKKVQEDTEALQGLLTNITSGFTRNSIAVDRLKTETAQGLHQAEMAQRMHEATAGLQYDNTAPGDYFIDLVTRFEEDALRLRIQMEDSEKHLRSMTQNETLSPQELTLAMKRLHECVVVLAAKVQTFHTSVQSHKEQYRNLGRIYLKEDVLYHYDAPTRTETKKQYGLRSLTGPTPFSDIPPVHQLNVLSGTNIFVPPTSTATDWNLTQQSSTGTTPFLPSSSTTVPVTPQPVENTGFQLAKPPLGNKRNKR